MSDTKDYSLLRPFDPEAAKRGEEICWNDGDPGVTFVAGPDADGDYCVVSDEGVFMLRKPACLRMAPLCWVEGRPVYRGDVLYSNCSDTGNHRVDRIYGNKAWQDSGDVGFIYIEHLTWTPPKVKREGWVNVYPAFCSVPSRVANTSHAYETKEAADSANCCNAGRIACVRIEWEEPAEVAK